VLVPTLPAAPSQLVGTTLPSNLVVANIGQYELKDSGMQILYSATQAQYLHRCASHRF
jgi:hypothetical protein